MEGAPRGTKGRLAKFIGIDNTKLSRILTGKRTIKIEEMEKAEQFFGELLRESSQAPFPKKPRPLTFEDFGIAPELAEEANELGIDWQAQARLGANERVTMAVKAERERRWREENREAIEAYNKMIEREGLPLLDLQVF